MAQMPMTLSELEGHFCSCNWQSASCSPSICICRASLFVVIIMLIAICICLCVENFSYTSVKRDFTELPKQGELESSRTVYTSARAAVVQFPHSGISCSLSVLHAVHPYKSRLI